MINKIDTLIMALQQRRHVTDVTVRFLDAEYAIDCVQIESFGGNETEPARTVVAIRCEVDGEIEIDIPERIERLKTELMKRQVTTDG